MAADPIVYCLEHLTDYAQFERFCHDLMVLEGYRSLEPLGGCQDKGRDAIHVNRSDGVVTIFCYSVREDWFAKLKQDVKIIHKHKHPCNRIVYLSTYDFTARERDAAVAFIKNKYVWELECFGLERLRVLVTKHRSIITSHPQLFHPNFFNGKMPEPPEIESIRSLMNRLITANEKCLRAHLRLIFWPYTGELSPASLASKDRHITVAIPEEDASGPLPVGCDVVLSKAAVQNYSSIDFWGAAGFSTGPGMRHRDARLVFLAWGGDLADVAVEEFTLLARESGRLYQTLPPSLAPIHGTTSPRNLWVSVLYGWLHGTTWVSDGGGFEFIPLPFAASAELWRRLLHGTTADGRVQSSVQISEGAERILLAATAARRQTVTMNSTMHGFHLGTGDGPIIDTKNNREIAQWTSWVEELLSEELIEDRWHKGQVFPVTMKGYELADAIRASVAGRIAHLRKSQSARLDQ